MNEIALRFCVLMALIVSAVSLQQPIITVDGVCKPSATIEKGFEEIERTVVPVSILDVGSSAETCKLCNDILDTSFSFNMNGVIAGSSSSSNLLALRCCFTEMISEGFCGAKAVDFCNHLGCSTAIVMKGDTVEVALRKAEPVLRRLVNAAKAKPSSIMLLLSIPEQINQDTLDTLIEDRFSIIAQELGQTDDYKQYLSITAIAINSEANEISSDVKNRIIEKFTSSGEGFDAGSLSTKLQASWMSVSSAPSTPVLTKDDQAALYELSSAFMSSQRAGISSLQTMQSRVTQGKIIPAFANRAERLVQSVLGDFHRLAPSQFVVERARRAKELQETLTASLLQLFTQQVLLKEQESLEKLRRELFNVHSKQDQPSAESIQQVVRSVLFGHSAAVAQLESEALQLTYNNAKEFSEKLTALADGFARSSDGQLAAIQRAEVAVRKSTKKSGKGRKAAGKKGGNLLSIIKLSTTLVGALRPPGNGNLQGFIGYSTALLGRPLDFLLGFQNDGDSVEILGEDREQPILRVQPKFHFDLDF